MRKTTFLDRLRYGFDNYMSRGTIALIAGLGLLTLAIIVVAGLTITVMDAHQDDQSGSLSFFEGAWEALMRTLDAGTMGGDTGRRFRAIMFLVTLGGVFIVSSLIGVLTSGVEGKLDELRKGRSRVIERNHTIILGWSPQIFSIISELIIANANQKKPRIVILGDKDKVEMEDEIRANVGDPGRTVIVCRTGSPIDLNDIEIVSPHDARSIIILSPEIGDADIHTIKTILALTHNPNRRSEPYHIVAEIRDPKNMEAARLVGRDEAQLVLAGDLISRITAQTCRQSGLSVVYTELLDFGGDEIYFKEETGLTGKTFGEALLAYEDSALIGLRLKDGRIQLNPPMNTQIAAGDKIITVAEDDDTIHMSGVSPVPIDPSVIRETRSSLHQPERTLILGWNRRASIIIHELDHYVALDSAVTIVADNVEENAWAHCCDDLHNQTFTFISGDTTSRRVLEGLEIPSYNHVIVLSYSDTLDPQDADAHTLVTLLHLRDIADHSGVDFAIVSEMLDLRNRELAEVTRADDFIVSDKLISLMLSQISENKELTAVFQDLFDPEGSELYLKPAGDYVDLGKPINFYTVVESARQRSEVALGYRIDAKRDRPGEAYGVFVNPDKSGKITYTELDRIIVLAED
jgi:voltage-gated potassium channel Kch